MPILAAEENCFPERLLTELPACEEDRQWWAVYTKARQEKALARELCGYEVPFYLPLIRKDNLIRGRRVSAMLPLFSGYLFVYGSNEERIQALSTNRISKVLPVADGEQLYRDLANVDRLLSSNAAVSLESRLAAGQHVRVKSGAFQGIEGIIISRRGVDRLLVSITYLQQGVSMEVNDFMVEPL